jgi:hypothetical protein
LEEEKILLLQFSLWVSHDPGQLNPNKRRQQDFYSPGIIWLRLYL